MIGKPIPHPRDAIIFELERQKTNYLASGKVIENIPNGYSGLSPIPNMEFYSGADTARFNTAQKRLQAVRAKLAPRLRKFAEDGGSILEAARSMRIKIERAQLIAKENNIIFLDKHC